MLNKIGSVFLKNLLDENYFSFVDYFFAYRFLKNFEKEELVLALAYLFKASRLGHLCVTVASTIVPSPDLLFKQEAENFSLDPKVEELMKKGFADLKIILDEMSFSKNPVCFFKDSFYLQRNYYFETQIVENLEKINKYTPIQYDRKIIKEEIDDLLNKKELSLSQANAINLIIERPLSFIFGGPGTGKTHTMAVLVRILAKALQGKRLKIIVGSLTGKAAHHLLSKMDLLEFPNISIEASTLHLLLKIGSRKKPFVDADLIIIDEASMVDTKILVRLFQTIGPLSRLVLVGDPGQLPPIDSGGLFAFFSTAKFMKISAFLTQVFRFENPTIHLLSLHIKSGDIKNSLEIIKEKKLLVSSLENKFLKEKILEEAKEKFLPASFSEDIEKSFDAFFNFRILSSMRLGHLGSRELNQIIYDHLLSFYRAGTFIMPIIILKNDYRLKLFNGTSGILVRKRWRGILKEEALFLDSSKKLSAIPSYMLPPYEYGYSLSVHKSQGSEFNSVLLVLPENVFFGRELLYTAVTRAKKEIEIISNYEIIEKILSNKMNPQTNLLERVNLL